MKDLGYDSHNCFAALGTVGILILVHTIMVIVTISVLMPIHYIKPGNKNFNWFMKELKNRIFFADILGLTSEPYLEILITTYFNFKHPVRTKIGEIFSIYFSIYVAVWSFLFVPILLIWVVWTK